MRWWALIASAVLIIYPLLVYWGTRWLEPRFLGLIVVAIYALRILIVTRRPALRWLVLVVILTAGALFWFLNSELLLKLVPALINLVLAAGFTYTLFYPPTLPARMAELQHGFITPAIARYTNRVTCMWIGFFCFNANLAVITAIWASREIWMLYNGLIAYVLIGLVFAGEYAYRRLVFFRKHNL